MGDKDEHKMGSVGKLYVSIAGQPFQELKHPVKFNLLSCCGTPYNERSKFDFSKKSFETSFDIASNPEIDKLMETLFKSSENAMQEFYEKIESFCRIFLEDFLGIKIDDFTKEH